MISNSWRSARAIIPLALLLMILMRLVWMQLRDYTVHADYRALVTHSILVDSLPEACGLEDDRMGSNLLTNFNEAKDIRKNPGYGWFLSPGLWLYSRLACQEGQYRPDKLVRLNQWLLVTIVALGSLLVRSLTGSWVFGMVAAAVLLSRGHLLGLVGDVGPWGVLTLLTMAWVVSCLHFFLTGSAITLITSQIFTAIGCLFEPMFWTFGTVIPAMLIGGILMRKYLAGPIMQRFWAEKRRLRTLFRRGKLKVYDGSVISGLALGVVERLLGPQAFEESPTYLHQPRRKQIQLFRALQEPFALWVFQKRRWRKVCLLTLPSALALMVMTLLIQRYGSGAEGGALNVSLGQTGLNFVWLATFIEDVTALVDWHLGVSMLLVVICAVQSPATGLKGYFEVSWLVLIAYLYATIGALAYDYVDFHVVRELESSFGVWSMMAWSRSPNVLIWFEPVFLVMGLASIYNLLVIINQRWAQHRLKSR